MGPTVFDVKPASELDRSRAELPAAVSVTDPAWREPALERFESDGVVCLRGVLNKENRT